MLEIDTEIIYQALDKACANGYDWHGMWSKADDEFKRVYAKSLAQDKSWRIYFFTREFAEAIWAGCEGDAKQRTEFRWERNLKNFVVAEDQLQYLKRFIE